MVRIIIVLAIVLERLSHIVVLVVLLGELTLNKSIVWNFPEQVLKTLDGPGGIQEEVHVGSLHAALDIVRLVLISKLILSESLSPFFLVTQVIALEDIVVGVGRVPLECVVGLLLNLFCISVSVGIVVSIGNCDSKL